MVKAKVNRTLDGYANGPVISLLAPGDFSR